MTTAMGEGIAEEPGRAEIQPPQPETSRQESAEQGTNDIQPALLGDCELSAAVTDIVSDSYEQAWVLLRVFDEPIGMVRVPFVDGVVSVAALLAEAKAECEQAIADRVEAAGGDVAAVLAGEGTVAVRTPAFLAEHEKVLADGPAITVVLCTHNRPADLRRALDSLGAQTYRRFDVLVVDNAPRDEATRLTVESRTDDFIVRYALEPRQGLSWARNCALSIVTAPVVAWMDDDEIADRHWLMEIAAGFVQVPDAVAVSGMVIPAEVRTKPQLWFEQYGGHTKGRGFTKDVFDARLPGAQSPLFPLPAFGAGANMAFRTEPLRRLGFDNALGAGTLTQGCEDTLAFSRLLLAGEKVAYRPSAVMRHYHRDDMAALQKQMYGYGTGLTAFYAALLRYEPTQIFALMALIPSAARTATGRAEHSMRGVPEDFPADLLRLKAKGMLAGPVLYVRARRRARRLARRGPA